MRVSDEQHHAIESRQGMLPWNGQQDNLIDRFDARALLDFYKEPDARAHSKPKTEAEAELEEVCSGTSTLLSVETAARPCSAVAIAVYLTDPLVAKVLGRVYAFSYIH